MGLNFIHQPGRRVTCLFMVPARNRLLPPRQRRYVQRPKKAPGRVNRGARVHSVLSHKYIVSRRIGQRK